MFEPRMGWSGEQIDRFLERYERWRDNGGWRKLITRWFIAFGIAVLVVYGGVVSSS